MYKTTGINLPRIEDIDVDGKTVFLRVDWNLPLDKQNDFKVTDTTRLEKSAPTIKLLQKRGAKLIISTHLGRPKGKKNPDLSTEHVLEEAINIFCPSVVTAMSLGFDFNGTIPTISLLFAAIACSELIPCVVT